MFRPAWCIALLAMGAAAVRSQDAPVAHFHHLHLNSTDPAAAIEFYTSKFDCEKARFAGVGDAVWAQKSWLLFNKVASPPAWEPISSVWHFGWGAEDMKATYQKQLDMGTKFFTPLTDISWLAGGVPFYYAYVDGPDHALIELNTASHHRFGHLHLLSEDPIETGEWYIKHFGATRRGNRPPSREVRFHEGAQYAPSMSLMIDNVNLIVYPIQYSRGAYKQYWKEGQTEIPSTKGRVVDHVAFSVDNLPETLERLRRDGVKVTEEIRPIAGGKLKSVFIEGPDRIRIEIVEGHAQREP
jgi:catechol 2,3-dioxygenase-like lactoylglutathione lyase family enzyme